MNLHFHFTPRWLSLSVLICFMAMFASNHVVFGQSQSYCHITPSANAVGEMIPPSFTESCDDVPNTNFYVRTRLHILRRSDKSGGQTPEAAKRALSIAADYFDDYGIFLTAECDLINYVDDDDYYRDGIDEACDLFAEFSDAKHIDIFVDAEDPILVGGSAAEIPSTGIVIGGIWDHELQQPATSVVETHVLIHEIGHCFGLWHTHHGTLQESGVDCNSMAIPSGTAELIERGLGGNCAHAGDYLCDTPADPGLNFDVTNSCAWIPDPDMDPPPPEPIENYTPDVYNFMAYSNIHCVNSFSSGQIGRMRCFLKHEDVLSDVCYEVPPPMTINTNTTWDLNTVPEGGNFVIEESLTIKSGATLTINPEITVRFAQDAELIVEPNATLDLYGVLTSLGCGRSWQGVKVYGNDDENQYFDFQAGRYHQGMFRGRPGSLVENAVAAVELFGPDPEDSGGRISCEYTTFMNNGAGVLAYPFVNLVNNQPRPYQAFFDSCVFTVNDNLPVTVLEQHIKLWGVDGVRIKGCTFENAQTTVESPSEQSSHGQGVVALDAGVMIYADFSGSEDICLPPCSIVKPTTFKGLGYGVRASSYLANKMIRVYQAEFEECYTGIEVDGPSGSTLLFNSFNMGTTRDPSALNGDQIGIKYNNRSTLFSVQENQFLHIPGNVSNTLGIVMEDVGELSNFVRKNKFDGLTISNEALGKNADGLEGLRYTCNENLNTTDKDFFVSNSQMYAVNNISGLQAGFDPSNQPIATGNAFSFTGNTGDGDFANLGVAINEYYFYLQNPQETPSATTGIIAEIPGAIGNCASEFCAPPCLSSQDLDDLRGEYNENLDKYNTAIAESEWILAAASKSVMDSACRMIIQHYLVDTLTFDRDSLRKWYGNVLALEGDMLQAKDYANAGDFVTADQIMANTLTKYNLSQVEQVDVGNMRQIFAMLAARGPGSLTQSNLDTLEVIETERGYASTMARALLWPYGYRFTTYYELPAQTQPPPIVTQEAIDPPQEGDYVYPNPTTGSITISLTNSEFSSAHIEIWSLAGAKMVQQELKNVVSTLVLPSQSTGPYVYRIVVDGKVSKVGRIVTIDEK